MTSRQIGQTVMGLRGHKELTGDSWDLRVRMYKKEKELKEMAKKLKVKASVS